MTTPQNNGTGDDEDANLSEPYRRALTYLRSSVAKTTDIEQSREIRQRFINKFTMLPKDWFVWLDSEMEEASPEDVDAIQSLVLRASQDFADSDLCVRFLQFILDTGSSFNRLEVLLPKYGHRTDMGSLYWMTFLPGVYLTLQPENLPAFSKRVEQALSYPNDALEEIYEFYTTTLKQTPSPHMQAHYDRMLAFFKDLTEVENDWQTWIALLSRKKDCNLIIAGYEQLLAKHPVNFEIWASYCQFAKNLNSPEAVDVYRRVSRLFVDEIFRWQEYLFQLERFGRSFDVLSDVFTEACEYAGDEYSAVALYRSIVYAKLRDVKKAPEAERNYNSVKELFEKALNDLQNSFGLHFDRDGAFRRAYAYFAFRYLKDVELGRRIWKQILGSGFGSRTRTWIDAAEAERHYGSLEGARNHLYRGINSVFENANELFDYFIQFERDEGDFESLSKALKKVNDQALRIAEAEAKKKAKTGKQQRQHASLQGPPQQHSSKSSVAIARAPSTKRKSDGGSADEQHVPPPPKKSSKEEVIKDKDGFVVPTMPARMSPRRQATRSPTTAMETGLSPSPSPPPVPAPVQPVATIQSAPEPAQSQPAKPVSSKTDQVETEPSKTTVFVSNLDFATTEADVAKHFPGSLSVRLVARPGTGLTKGYGYVDFATEQEATAALALDRSKIKGRPVFVSENKPHPKGEHTEFKYPTTIERNKLFAKNLPFSCDSKRLKKAFTPFGNVVDARVVTKKNGISKCCGFIEFSNEEDAGKAVVAEIDIDGRRIEVYISNPPKKEVVRSNQAPPPKSQRPKPPQANVPATHGAPGQRPRLAITPVSAFVPVVIAKRK